MKKIIKNFFDAYFSAKLMKTVYVAGKTPTEMMASAVDQEGWFKWKPLEGTFTLDQYAEIEEKFGVKYPKSFTEWHSTYFFLDGDCSIIRLPYSNPQSPLLEVIENLDYDLSKRLARSKLYAFGEEGNDGGPLVFDGRMDVSDNEFPIRFYDHDYGGNLDGLSEIIFSSFPKLLECVTHYLIETKTRKDYEVIPEFLAIDPDGAGKYGVDYWLAVATMRKETDNYFAQDNI